MMGFNSCPTVSKPLKIVIHVNNLNRRAGTGVAINYARMLLQVGHTVYISYDPSAGGSEDFAVDFVKKQFPLFMGSVKRDFDAIASDVGATHYYFLKSGGRDSKITTKARCLIHAVFPTPPSDVHGDRFAFVSRWLSDYCSGGTVPVVPHVHEYSELNDGFGKSGIASQDVRGSHGLVIGLLGGATSFDLRFARDALRDFLDSGPNRSVLSLGVDPGFKHSKVTILEPTNDIVCKANFIDDCTLLLHGRRMGETFGLSVAEFASRGKPVACYAYPEHSAHLDYLGPNALVFFGRKSLLRILTRVERGDEILIEGHYPRFKEVKDAFEKFFLSDEDFSLKSGFGPLQDFKYGAKSWFSDRRRAFMMGLWRWL
jgi:hypothetical protein